MSGIRAELRAAGIASCAIVAMGVGGYLGLRVIPAWLLDLDVPFAPVLMIAWLLIAAGALVCAVIFAVRQFLRTLSRMRSNDD